MKKEAPNSCYDAPFLHTLSYLLLFYSYFLVAASAAFTCSSSCL